MLKEEFRDCLEAEGLALLWLIMCIFGKGPLLGGNRIASGQCGMNGRLYSCGRVASGMELGTRMPMGYSQQKVRKRTFGCMFGCACKGTFMYTWFGSLTACTRGVQV